MRSVLFAVGVSLCIVIGIFVYRTIIRIPVPDAQPESIRKKLYSSSLNNYIYLRRESRGINYEKTAITASNSESFEPDPEVDYIFESSTTPVFYYVKQDTLVVYSTATALVPPRTVHNFKVKQIEISSAELKKLRRHFREKGLGMF